MAITITNIVFFSVPVTESAIHKYSRIHRKMMIAQICWKVIQIGQNCKVHNSPGLIEVALTDCCNRGIQTSWRNWLLKFVESLGFLSFIKITLDGSVHIKQFHTVWLFDQKRRLNLKILTCNNVRTAHSHSHCTDKVCLVFRGCL